MASIKITLSLLLFLAILTHSTAKLRHYKETEMTVYFKDYLSGPNLTTIAIPGQSTGPLNFTKFGAMFVMDDVITKEVGEGSAPIGRGRGIIVTSALDGADFLMLMSIVFTNGKYKGSTLEIQGAYAQFERVTEVAVVGGTGKFRLARGYTTFETVHYDSVYTVLQCNMTVQHY